MTNLVEETLALRGRYDEEPSHSDHVALLALKIFDGLSSWHEFAGKQRDLLHSAALLHDIGWSQTPDGKGHHKWSARLIQEHKWQNLKRDEVIIVAQTARYHRKSIPQPEHTDFQALSATSKKLVMILGGILRIADALDRTHTGMIECLTASLNKDVLLIEVKAKGNWDAERIMFMTKRDMLQLAVGRPVHCVVQG